MKNFREDSSKAKLGKGNTRQLELFSSQDSRSALSYCVDPQERPFDLADSRDHMSVDHSVEYAQNLWSEIVHERTLAPSFD